MALGGRVKHLEVELAKSERAREELRGKKEAEMLQVRYEKCSKCENHNFKKNPVFLPLKWFSLQLQGEVEMQEAEVERLTNEKKRLLQQLEIAWNTSAERGRSAVD